MTEAVWVMESGEYEERGIDLIAASPERAVAALKERLAAAEYIVTWESPIDQGDHWDLTGHFTQLRGRSTEHTTYYTITRWEVA